MWLPHIVSTLFIFASISGGYGGFLDLFNTSSDFNLGALLDIGFGTLRNDIRLIFDDETVVPVDQDVTFWCKKSSKSALTQTYLNDPNLGQKLDLTKPLTCYTHGWLDTVNSTWAQDIVQNFVTYTDNNVCLVSWSRLSRFNYYRTAINHTVIVSNYLTQFIVFLESAGVPLGKVTLVGHSMGAQISGQVGYKLGGMIGKIYGLDPAGPCFTFPVDRGLRVRLDRTDAKFVQTIITSKCTIGVCVGEGHENFYPNGGDSPQTNCVAPITSDAEFADQIMCSHLHSRTLFTLSLNPLNVYRGRHCSDWVLYTWGFCFYQPTSLLGVRSSKLNGGFYLRTSAFSPYTV